MGSTANNACSSTGDCNTSSNTQQANSQQNTQQEQQPGLLGQALNFAFSATGTEKPKDAAGWAELFVRAKATADRNTKKN